MSHQQRGSGRGLTLSPQRRALLEKKLAAAGLRTGDADVETGIPRRDRALPAPLSYAQQRLWFMDQLAPDNPFYNVPVVMRIEMPVDASALRRSLTELVRRHEVLRTSFPVIDDLPVQVVAEDNAVALPVVDLRSHPAEGRRAEVERLANLEAREPFDLETGPVLRAELVTLSDAEHWFLLTLHHIVTDGWSMGVLTRELGELYKAAVVGKRAELPELPIQYADFACWQRERLRGERLDRQLDYWRGQLADVQPLRLVTDRPRGSTPTFEGAVHHFEIPEAVIKGLRRLAQETGATLYMVLLAGFQTLLARYCGQDDIVVGSPIANRTHRDLENLIGFFVNTLVMRGDLSGAPSFRELVDRTRRTALDAFAHQDVPFEKLVEELQPDRDPSRNPLFQVGFVLQTAWDVERGAVGNRLGDDQSQPEIQRGTSIFDLAMHLWERGDGMGGAVEYSTALFDPPTIARFGEHLGLLLEGAAREPDVAIADLQLMREHERHRLLSAWNRTRAEFDETACFHQLFEARARARPDAPALRFADTELTYLKLDERANALAHLLRERGVRRDVPVLLGLERSPEMIVAVLAVLKAGGAYVPLDPSYPADRLHFMIADTGAPLLVTTSRLMGSVFGELPASGAPRTVQIDALDSALAAAPTDAPESDVGPRDLAYIIYTSGSTGRPKGAMVEHRGLCNVAAAQQRLFGAGPGSRVLQFASLSFDASIFEISMALASGGTLCLAPSELLLPGPALADLLRRESVTIVTLPPSALAAMPREPLPELETITVAGEACPASLVERWGGGRRFFNLYGPTEATIWSTCAECAAGDGKPSIGRPVPNTSIYILDGRGRPVPVGVPGELYVGGVGLARGYLNRPQLTEERFVDIALDGGPEDRLYRTGDLARYRADGNVDFLGRVDHQVKVRGFRIELEEIESVLGDLPSLQEAVVTVREDQPGDKRLVAYVTPSHDFAAVDEKTARELALEQVSYWQRIYDDIYHDRTVGDNADRADPTFNISGWSSSYTGEPLPAEAMREWVEHGVARILALEPRRVLEIGCGSGLLLFRIAPSCEAYTATDLSGEALAYIDRHRSSLDGAADRVRLLEREANDFTGLASGEHDLVVLNSVAQYFPSVDYLREVLAGAVEAVAPEGAIYLGDLRSLPLLETFAMAVELDRAEDQMTLADLEERVRRRLMLEQELVIDPELFCALRRELPEIQGVEILPKRGRHLNELTKFRYDVVLHVGKTPAVAGDAARADWSHESLTLEGLRTRLTERAPEVLHLTGIPSHRLSGELRVRAALSRLDATSVVGELRAAAHGPPQGVEPEDVLAIAADLGYEAELHESWGGGVGTFDALVTRFSRGAVIPRAPLLESRAKPWSHYTNTPFRGIFLRKMVPRIRAFLEARLPDFMVPSQYVLLDRIPHTPSGKVDRAKLPAPGRARPDLGVEYAPPAIEIEKTLAAIWSDVLGVERVGVHDNFFELGGDSILGIQIVARARDAGLELSPKDLFEHQTIAELVTVCGAADAVSAEQGPVVGDVPLTPIQHWFFELGSAERGGFYQTVTLEFQPPLDCQRLRQAVGHLCDHHDALRLRFDQHADGWRQLSAQPEEAPPVDELDLSSLPIERRSQALEEAIAATAASLQPQRGPLFRALLVHLGPTEPVYLILAAHGLVIDSASWPVLLEDLRTAHLQLDQAEEVSLPAKTVSFSRWAGLLQEEAESEASRREMTHWTDLGARPLEGEARADGGERRRSVSADLSEVDTSLLRDELSRLFNVQLDEVVLAAAAHALALWSGSEDALVELERDGRQLLFRDLDLSRTVGCLMISAPIRLDVAGLSDAEEILKSVKEQLRAVPRVGAGYGILRYLSPDPAVRATLAALPRPGIRFRYLGELDGAARTTAAPGLHRLELVAQVIHGRLSIDLGFDADRDTIESVESLRDQVVCGLEGYVSLARSGGRRRFTASDFSDAKLSQSEFAKLMGQLARKRPEDSDVP